MQLPLIAADKSEFQNYLTDAYGRRLLIMRASFGAHYQDQKFLHDASTAAAMYRKGEIDGVVLYTVYLATATPAEQYAYLWTLIGPTVPDWLVAVMIDAERWAGTSYAISGDHSRPLNTLYGMHAHKMGHWSACIGYGNASDLGGLWPQRDTRCWVIEAKYTRSTRFDVPRCLGIQYTDGQAKWGVPVIGGQPLPRSSTPFGACDHNVFPAFPSAKALRAFLRPSAPAVPPKPVAHPAAAPTGYYSAYPAGNVMRSADRNSAVFFGNDGRLDVRTAGKHTRYI